MTDHILYIMRNFVLVEIFACENDIYLVVSVIIIRNFILGQKVIVLSRGYSSFFNVRYFDATKYFLYIVFFY